MNLANVSASDRRLIAQSLELLKSSWRTYLKAAIAAINKDNVETHQAVIQAGQEISKRGRTLAANLSRYGVEVPAHWTTWLGMLGPVEKESALTAELISEKKATKTRNLTKYIEGIVAELTELTGQIQIPIASETFADLPKLSRKLLDAFNGQDTVAIKDAFRHVHGRKAFDKRARASFLKLVNRTSDALRKHYFSMFPTGESLEMRKTKLPADSQK